MVRRRYPYSWMMRDFEEMLSDIDALFQPFSAGRLLPAGNVAERMLPAIRGEFRVDIREHEDEVIVVADLPGIEKGDVSIRLSNPRTLEVYSERKDDKEEKSEGYYVRERLYGSMSRTVALPTDVTDLGAQASFKNGVLEVRLKVVSLEHGAKIPIE
ncbi:MAG: Hsp20/alpha crystallin family protein [Methanomicrobiales archaeon]|nr:Hsp20/alpha crystallin family protein [Methanomicrobiales archaeon]